MKYTEKEYRCWAKYPNTAFKKNNGEWKCVDQYRCISDYSWKRKTRCVLIEQIRKENE